MMTHETLSGWARPDRLLQRAGKAGCILTSRSVLHSRCESIRPDPPIEVGTVLEGPVNLGLGKRDINFSREATIKLVIHFVYFCFCINDQGSFFLPSYGKYLPPVANCCAPSKPPQTSISVPVQIASWALLPEGAFVVESGCQELISGANRPPLLR